MLKICSVIFTLLLSISVLAQVEITNDYKSPTTINMSESGDFSSFRLVNNLHPVNYNLSAEFTNPSCSRGMAEESFYFDFIVSESGVATVNVKFSSHTFFGISLYKQVNGDYVEVSCQAFRSDEGYIFLEDENMNLANENVLARIWMPVIEVSDIVNISVKPYIQDNIYEKGTLTVLPDQYTPEQLVLDILISGCVEASNVQYTGHADAIGFFDNASHLIGINDGIIMSSGRVITALGPNSSGSSGTNLQQPGDAALQSLVNGTTYDAAILQFDFIPASEDLEFRYVFASEEYPEFANSSFNDVFAFFINGGPENYTNTNIALLPGSTTPVTINNVNHVNGSQYYISNWSPSTINIEYDGFTIVLTAMAAVTPCETYSMRLGIADVADGIYDSAVFLEAGSFFSGASVQAENISGVGESNDIWEGCSNTYEISLIEGADNSQDIVIDVEIDQANSTAVEGVDFTNFPSQITIPAGETSVSFDYSAFSLEEEGDVFFIVSFFTSCPCGNIPADPIVDTIWIYNFEFVKGGIQDIQTLYCGSDAPDAIELEGKTNLDPEISYLWCNGQTGPFTTVDTQFGETTYFLTMSDVCGNELYDSVTVRISDINVANTNVIHPSCNGACDGRYEITMDGTFTPFIYRYANENWVWWPDSVHTTSLNTFTGLCPANYRLTVTDAIGCFHRLDFSIPNPPPISQAPGLLDNDMRFCEDPGEITLTAASNQPNPVYQWSTGATTETITITPNTGETSYWVRLFDGCGNFKEDQLVIKYSDIEVDLVKTPDYGECDGTVSAFASNGLWPYNYFWEAPLSSFNYMQENLCAGTYTLQVSDNNDCNKIIEVIIDEYSFVDQSNYGHVFTVFPNPSAGEFIIDYDKMYMENVSVRITDVRGKVIKTFILDTDTKSVSGLNAGVYFVELQKEEGIIGVQKIVITK